MPELPDITLYVEALAARVQSRTLRARESGESRFFSEARSQRWRNAFGHRVRDVGARLGKRIAFGLGNDLWLVIPLDDRRAPAPWFASGERRSRRRALATFEFDSGTLTLTEAGTQRRASLHVVRGEQGLRSHERRAWRFSMLRAGVRAAPALGEPHPQARAH